MAVSWVPRIAIIIAATVTASVLGAPPSHAIRGGQLAAKGEFPFMVSLGTKDLGVHLCGGSLIHRDWVLTAAHCVADKDPTALAYNAVIGRANLFDTSDGEVVVVSQFFVHPNFNPTTHDYDVALMKLKYSATKTPLKLGFTAHRGLWNAGEMATAAGWGVTFPGGQSVSELRKVNLPIISDSEMSDAYHLSFHPDTMVGAGYLAGGKDTCPGDSGGPLFVQSATGPRQVGITSWGSCGFPDQPGVYSRVAEAPIQSWLIGMIPDLANDGVANRSGDFDGDGRDDVITFTRGSSCDVYVARSTGSAFAAATKWHDHFACGDETPVIGDFNDDGYDDIATFTRGFSCDVYVAVSNGATFIGTGVKWHDMFACLGAIPAAGDFDGDGDDDLVEFQRGSSCDVYVARSTGYNFGATAKWHDMFACGAEIPAVGDFNNDGRDDIITFTRGYTADAFVALAYGTAFLGTGIRWSDDVAYTVALPAVGDFNNDGFADVASFYRGTCDVIVHLNLGSLLGPGVKWHDGFGCGNEVPGVGDFNKDGRDDVVTFTRGLSCNVWVAKSTGSGLGAGVKWSDMFSCNGEIPAGGTAW